ncbi:MAG: glycoside hydrolase family 88 protein [Bacteroidaceae bacterium]|nr:glycoside hydrolase family 88 protein [Bacteroidaceae bacterium]
MRKLLLIIACCCFASAFAQSEVLQTARKANDYFMAKYADPTQATNVGRIRPSSLWTRAVYYEGLMALQALEPQQRYVDYAVRWADFHQWTPRNGVTTCDADDQCCAQTYVELVPYTGKDYKQLLGNVIANLDHQMQTPNTRKIITGKEMNSAEDSLLGWWTWIDAIQMAMPLYMQVTRLTGEAKYSRHALRMYLWSRNTCGGGLFNEREGLWWRDADYVPPYKESDGHNCYWSRGNGWVFAALVRSMSQLPHRDKAYRQLKKDFLRMSEALLKCQHADGFWHASLVSDADYPTPEMTGTALFLYGMAWGIRQGFLSEKAYGPACDRAWQALKSCLRPDGSLGWAQGTGKDPSAGQPVTYESTPNFEDYGTGCYLLALTEYHKLKFRKNR